MAEERDKPTVNFGRVSMGVSNDASLEPRMLRVDPTTGRLLVDTSVTGSVGALDQFDLTNKNPLAVAMTDGNGDQITSFGGTPYTEDVAAAADPIGFMGMAVRADTLAAVTTTDGDNIALRSTNKGELYVKQSDAVSANIVSGQTGITAGTGNVAANTPRVVLADDRGLPAGSNAIGKLAANSGVDIGDVDVLTINGVAPAYGAGAVGATVPRMTLASDDPAVTSVQLIDDMIKADDAAFTPATTKVAMAGFEFDDSTPDSVDEGDAGAARMSANRNIYTTLRDAAGNERGANVNASNELLVAVSSIPSHAVTNAGTFAVQAAGDVAAGATDSGNPVKVGGKYNSTRPTLTDGQRGDLQLGTRGSLGVTLFASDSTTSISATSSSDGRLTSQTAILTDARLMTNNSSSWDQLRSIINATNSIGTGILAAGMVGQFDDSSPTAITENQFGNLRMSTNRNLYQTIRDAAGNERGLNVDANGEIGIGAIRTSVTPGTAAGNLGKAEDAVHSSGDTGVFILAVSNEANTTRNADSDYSIVATDTEGNVRVVGNRDHDAADAGETVKVGYFAVASNTTRVSAADRTHGVADLAGRQVVQLGHVREMRAKQTTTISASTSETTIVTAGGAGVFNDLIAIVISNTSATATRVDVRDATSGTILFSLYIPAGDMRGFSLPGSSIPQTTAANNWTAQSSASVTDLRVLAIFEKNT